MKRREFITVLSVAALAWPFPGQTQPSTNPRRVGMLMGYKEDEHQIQLLLVEFREALGKLGWLKDKTSSSTIAGRAWTRPSWSRRPRSLSHYNRI